MTNQNERVIGVIIYAASSPDYDIQHVVFTDRQVLGIPASKLTGAAQKGAALGSIGLLLVGANPSTAFGLSGLLGMNAWSNLKKNVVGKQTISYEEGELSQGLLNAAKIKIPYERVKDVSIKKVLGVNDVLLNVNAGFLSSSSWVFAPSVEEVKALIQKTPLAQRLKQA